MSDIPERIWLQTDEDYDGTDEFLDATTWCRDKINSDDVEYVRADKLAAARALLREAVVAVEEEEDQLRAIGTDGLWPNIAWLEAARAAGGGE